MALLHSDKVLIGAPAPDFHLRSVDGADYSLASFKDKQVLVVMFICAHCPYVQAIEGRIIQFQRDYASKSLALVGICSNDPTDYPDDSTENLRKRWLEKDYRFPYLVDETQETARAYGAVCTPDIFVYDDKRRLAYRGQLDNDWKEPSKVTRKDLWLAVDALLAHKLPTKEQVSSMGCSIKWKKEKIR